MNKELEAFKNITEFIEHSDYYIDCFNALKTEYHKDKRKVEQALLELQAIKEAKPSEVLEETLRDIAYDLADDDNTILRDRYYGILAVKQALLNAEKLEKAWEVVKEKNVIIYAIKECDSVDKYNLYVEKCFNYDIDKLLTEEEFELLKEMIG